MNIFLKNDARSASSDAENFCSAGCPAKLMPTGSRTIFLKRIIGWIRHRPSIDLWSVPEVCTKEASTVMDMCASHKRFAHLYMQYYIMKISEILIYASQNKGFSMMLMTNVVEICRNCQSFDRYRFIDCWFCQFPSNEIDNHWSHFLSDCGGKHTAVFVDASWSWMSSSYARWWWEIDRWIIEFMSSGCAVAVTFVTVHSCSFYRLTRNGENQNKVNDERRAGRHRDSISFPCPFSRMNRRI